MKISEDDIKYIQRWQKDWNLCARQLFRVNLDNDQQKILEAIQYNRRVSIRSGTARGKDFVCALASLIFLFLNGISTKVINTAPTGRQVKNIMLPEIKRIYSGCAFPLGGELMADGIRFVKQPNKFLTGFKASDESIEAWSGLHAENLMVVVTEASGISQTTFDAIEGILQGNSRLVLAFNPNNTIGEAYQSTKSKLYKSFKLNCLDSPNVLAKKIVIPGQVDYDWVVEKIDKGWAMPIQESKIDKTKFDFYFEGKWYRPNDLFRIKVLGEFPEEAEGTLIPISWIEHANQKWESLDKEAVEEIQKEERLTLGVDVAGMGRDMSALAYRWESYLEKIDTIGNSNQMNLAGVVKDTLKKYDSAALIDTIGEGSGLFFRLKEQNEKVVSAKASQSKTPKDTTGQLRFLNMRAYMYWALREALNPNNPNSLAMPKDDDLAQELNETKWEFISDGRIKIEPKEEIKKRLGRSPDKADSLALTYFPKIRYKRLFSEKERGVMTSSQIENFLASNY